MKLHLAFVLLIFAFRLLADEAEVPVEREVPLTLSLVGPISSNFGKYEQTNSYFCLGLISCSTATSYVMSLTPYGINITEYDMEGLALSTYGNYAMRNVRGVQLSVIANTAARRMQGLQISFVNLVFQESLMGMQLGAFNMNFGKTMGAQLGLFNYTNEETSGLQLGVVNTIGGSSTEDGADFAVQYGFFNYSDQPGVVPIGIFNIVRGGRFQLELNYAALGVPRIDFIMGSNYFYSMFSLDSYSISPVDKKESTNTSAVAEGFGLGAAMPVAPGFHIRLESRQYFPTKSRMDRSRVVRALVEKEWSYGLAFSIGFEKYRFMERRINRSTYAENKPDQATSLTAGVSVNLIEGW